MTEPTRKSINSKLLNRLRKKLLNISIELTAYGPMETLNSEEEISEFVRDVKESLRNHLREKHDIMVEDEYVHVFKTNVFH